MSKFLTIDYFNDENISSVWREISKTVSIDIDIHLSYLGPLIKVVDRKSQKLLLTILAFEQSIEWKKFADDDNVTATDFSEVMDVQVKEIFDIFKRGKPKKIKKINFLSDWYGDYKYAGL